MIPSRNSLVSSFGFENPSSRLSSRAWTKSLTGLCFQAKRVTEVKHVIVEPVVTDTVGQDQAIDSLRMLDGENQAHGSPRVVPDHVDRLDSEQLEKRPDGPRLILKRAVEPISAIGPPVAPGSLGRSHGSPLGRREELRDEKRNPHVRDSMHEKDDLLMDLSGVDVAERERQNGQPSLPEGRVRAAMPETPANPSSSVRACLRASGASGEFY